MDVLTRGDVHAVVFWTQEIMWLASCIDVLKRSSIGSPKAVGANRAQGGMRSELVTAKLVTGDENGRDDIDSSRSSGRLKEHWHHTCGDWRGESTLQKGSRSRDECLNICYVSKALRAIDPAAGAVERCVVSLSDQEVVT